MDIFASSNDTHAVTLGERGLDSVAYQSSCCNYHFKSPGCGPSDSFYDIMTSAARAQVFFSFPLKLQSVTFHMFKLQLAGRQWKYHRPRRVECECTMLFTEGIKLDGIGTLNWMGATQHNLSNHAKCDFCSVSVHTTKVVYNNSMLI